MEATYDIAILGNGILGRTTAYAIASRDPRVRVAVIGPGERRGAASLAAGAMLNCFAEITKNTLATPFGRAKFAIGLEALRRWPSWLDELSERLPGRRLTSTPGTYIILNSRSGRLDTMNFAATVAALDEYDEPYEEIDPDAVPGLDPAVDARPLRALHVPGEGSIDSHLVLDALAEVATTQPGITYVDDEVVTVRAGAAGATHVELASGASVLAATFIVAAGSFAQRIIDSFSEPGAIPPIFAGVGVSFTADRVKGEPFTAVVRTPNRSGSCGLHLVPHTDRTVYVGASNNMALVPESAPRTGLCHFLATCAMEQLDQGLYDARISSWRVGNRPASLDTFPLIGRTTLPNVYLLGGTYRDGFHCSPVLSEHMASLALGGPGTLAHPFHPVRPPIQTMTVDESIDEMVLHYISGAYENAMALPKFLTERDIEPLVRTRMAAVYDSLDNDMGLAPEFLAMIEFSLSGESDAGVVSDYLRSAAKFHRRGDGSPYVTDLTTGW
jgi:glycine/D-amino acid oxidase-like deaminating enzyme